MWGGGSRKISGPFWDAVRQSERMVLRVPNFEKRWNEGVLFILAGYKKRSQVWSTESIKTLGLVEASAW